MIGRSGASAFLCIPSPALALLLCLSMRRASPAWQVTVAVGIAVFARVLFASAASVALAARAPHVLHARARGLSVSRVTLHHVLRRSTPALSALLATAVPLALGVAIPVETVCNLPGVGHLTLLAAQKRDLPLLAGLTLALLALTLISGNLARYASRASAGVADGRAL